MQSVFAEKKKKREKIAKYLSFFFSFLLFYLSVKRRLSKPFHFFFVLSSALCSKR